MTKRSRPFDPQKYLQEGVTLIRTEADYAAAMKEVERLWGAKLGTPDGDRLDALATLIEAYEEERYGRSGGLSISRKPVRPTGKREP